MASKPFDVIKKTLTRIPRFNVTSQERNQSNKNWETSFQEGVIKTK